MLRMQAYKNGWVPPSPWGPSPHPPQGQGCEGVILPLFLTLCYQFCFPPWEIVHSVSEELSVSLYN